MDSELRNLNISKLDNYLYFFIADDEASARTVDEEKDSQFGIYHLKVGADTGLVKEVQFHQSDIQYLKEARIANDADTKDGFLRAKYDAKIKLVGNALFAPGQYIYVHPSVPGFQSMPNYRENLQKIGLGGYFLVTKVFHIVSSDYYQTEVEARWEAYGTPPNAEERPLIPMVVPGAVGDCLVRAPEAKETYINLTEEEKTASADAIKARKADAARRLDEGNFSNPFAEDFQYTWYAVEAIADYGDALYDEWTSDEEEE